MVDQSRTVLRNLTFAWIEFLGSADAIHFLAGVKAMGGKNLFELLTPDPAAPDLKFIPARSKSPPVLAKRVGRFWIGKVNDFSDRAPRRTDDAAVLRARSEARDFAEDWVVNPRVFGHEVIADPFAGMAADFLAISGHGSGGVVWAGKDDKGAFSVNGVQVPLSFTVSTALQSGSLKCVLLASCSNLSADLGPLWVRAFRRVTRTAGDEAVGLRLALGYDDGYPGGKKGGHVMRNFLGRVRKNPRVPILEAWRKANTKGTNRNLDRTLPWAAFAFKGAVGDNFSDWSDKKLAAVTLKDQILHFTGDHAGGEPAVEKRPVRIRWKMSTPPGEITTENRMDPKVGLFPGRKVSVTIELGPTVPSPSIGEHAFLLFYYYRPAKSVDAEKLIDFDEAPTSNGSLKVQKAYGVNTERSEAVVQGVMLTALREGERRFDIEFTLQSKITLKDAHDGTRGNITLGFFGFDLGDDGYTQVHKRILPAEFGALVRGN